LNAVDIERIAIGVDNDPSTVQPTTPVPIMAKCPPFLIAKSRKDDAAGILERDCLVRTCGGPAEVLVETSPGSFPERTFVTIPLALRLPPSMRPGPEIMTF